MPIVGQSSALAMPNLINYFQKYAMNIDQMFVSSTIMMINLCNVLTIYQTNIICIMIEDITESSFVFLNKFRKSISKFLKAPSIFLIKMLIFYFIGCQEMVSADSLCVKVVPSIMTDIKLNKMCYFIITYFRVLLPNGWVLFSHL